MYLRSFLAVGVSLGLVSFAAPHASALRNGTLLDAITGYSAAVADAGLAATNVTGGQQPDATNLTNAPGAAVAPAAPAVVGPPVGSTSNDFAPMLLWNLPPNVTQYHLQVIPANNDGPGINLIRNVETSFSLAAPLLGAGNYVLLPDMTYTWQVRVATATESLGEDDSRWSGWAVGRFHTGVATSDGIAAVLPSLGATVESATPTLIWNNTDSRIFYYDLQISAAPQFGPDTFLYSEAVHAGASNPVSSYTVPSQFPLSPATSYSWRVRPRVQGDGTPVAWSAVFTFTTP